MYNKLRECFHYKCKITFRIALLFLNKHQILSTRFDAAFCGNSVNKFDCRTFSLFETVTRGSQIKTIAIEPNCWDCSTFLNKHQIPSRSLKGCFSGNPGKSPDCRAFINSRFTFNTRDHLTGAKTLYCFPYDLCFIMIILFYPQSAFYPWSAVCSLHFTLSLHFTPGLQSAFYTDRLYYSFKRPYKLQVIHL